MPFPDELGDVAVVPYCDSWPGDFDVIASVLLPIDDGREGVWIVDHVGSTAVPGLAAKDVIDVQICVPVVHVDRVIERFDPHGFRRRPEPWNNLEATRSGSEPKLVFAPPPGDRRANVHVRSRGSQGARDTLLFRDFLRADTTERDRWSAFKRGLVGPGVDLIAYGQAKAPAWADLMVRADAWADAAGWRPFEPSR